MVPVPWREGGKVGLLVSGQMGASWLLDELGVHHRTRRGPNHHGPNRRSPSRYQTRTRGRGGQSQYPRTTGRHSGFP